MVREASVVVDGYKGKRGGESMWKNESFSFDIMYYLASLCNLNHGFCPLSKPCCLSVFIDIRVSITMTYC